MPGNNISELLLRSGDIAAEGARRSGGIWGGAVQNIGEIASGALQQHVEARDKKRQADEMGKRDAAWTSAVESWDGKDPRQLYSFASRLYDPKTAMQMTQAVVSFHQMAGKGDDDDLEHAFNIAGALSSGKISPQQWERWGPGIQAKVRPVVENIFGPSTMSPEEQALRAERDPAGMEAEEQPWSYEQAREGAQALLSLRKEKERRTKVVGGALIDEDTGQPIYREPQAPPKRHVVTTPGPGGRPITKAVTEDELAAGVPAYREPKAPRDERLVQIQGVGPDGKPGAIWVPESQAVGKPAAQAARGVTGKERTDLGFYNRAKQASDDIAPLEETIKDAGIVDQGRLAYDGPGGNFLKSQEQQSYRQAQRAFTEARLRKESGAAIPNDEYENDAKTYFAQPGDTAETLEQKRRARQVVLDNLAYGAGRAYDEFYGEPAPTPSGRGSRGAQPTGGGKPGAPKNGERRTIGGQLAEWDGHGWAAVE